MRYALSLANPPKREIVTYRPQALATLALLALGASPARAQITTVFAPPVAKSQTVAALPSSRARRDSISRARLTDMKAWVDSAAASAGVAQGKTTVVSTGEVAAPTPAPVPAPAVGGKAAASAASFHDGVTAPATASPLPLLALLGLAALGAGALMTRNRA
ncbi:MAG: hypothetical protein NVS1B4_22210 [Gemmatimonadaceae bacterium]